MNKDSNLRKSLKKAFEEHNEPLREAQWDRLSAALDKEKPERRRFLPWFFSSLGVILIALVFGYWFGKNNTALVKENLGSSKMSVNSQTDIADTTAKPSLNAPIQNPVQDSILKNTVVSKNGNQTLAQANKGPKPLANKRPNSLSNGNTTSYELGNGPIPIVIIKYDVPESVNNKNQPLPIITFNDNGTDNEQKNAEHQGKSKDTNTQQQSEIKTSKTASNKMAKNSNDSSVYIKTGQDLSVNSGVGNNSVAVTNKDSLNKNSKGKNNDNEVTQRKKFAIGFSSGISPVNVKVAGIENSNKVHKDARTLFDQANSNSGSFYANLNFDWYLLKNFSLSFNTGIQFRQIQQQVNIDYKFNEIPFTGVDNSITGYLHVDDSANPVIYHIHGLNTLNYVNIPLKFGYTIPINKKSEIILTSGLNLSIMTKAKGEGFSFKDAEFRPLSTFYENKINAGLIGGLQYGRLIRGPWWFGLEAQWQQNRYNYNAGYGVIKSKINIANYNICLRYKF